MFEKKAKMFMQEAFDHFKPIAVSNEGEQWFKEKQLPSKTGVVINKQQPDDFSKQFIDAIAAHRFWDRSIL